MDSKPIQNMWILSIKIELNTHQLYTHQPKYSYKCYNLPKGHIQFKYSSFLIQQIMKTSQIWKWL